MNALSLIEKIACLPSEDKAQVEWLVDRFLASPQKKGCGCHTIDPKKQSIIIWPSKNPKHANDLIIKFMDQRMIAMPRVDKRGEKYWKVRDFYENEEEPEINSNSSLASLETNQPLNSNNDRLIKFQERQAKAQQLQSQTKWIEGKERLAQLEKEKAERKAQQSAQENTQNPENIPQEKTKENANHPEPTSEQSRST